VVSPWPDDNSANKFPVSVKGVVFLDGKVTLLLRDCVAEFERRVDGLLDYEATCPPATMGELEAEAPRLGRDCFAPVLEGCCSGVPRR